MLAGHMGRGQRRVTVRIIVAGLLARAVWHRLRGNAEAVRSYRAWIRGYLSQPTRP
jgi:hypothetical protein